MTYLDIYNIEGGDKKLSGKNITFGVFMVFILICIVALIYLMYYVVNTEKQKSEKKTTSEASPPASTGSESATVPQAMAANAQAMQANAQAMQANEQPQSESNNVKSPFTNDLPYQENKEMIELKDDGEYNDILQRMALDDDVIKQHNQYVNDRNKITSTASFEPERSDSQDIVTRWGLAGVSYIKPDPSAREVPSQTPEQGSKPRRLQWN